MDLCAIGWNNSHRVEKGLAPGRVASENREFCELWTEEGELTARAAPHGPQPVTGDWVAYEPNSRTIRDVLPRRTKVSRKKAGREVQEQVLAANVDVVFVVNGLDHDFNLRRLERYLVLVEESGAAPVIVLNKSDLHPDPLDALRQVDAIARHADVVVTSALDPDTVAQLHRYVEPAQTAVLLGSSGAGKSTILNQLLGRMAQPTKGVREHDGRGKHTTTARQMFRLEQGWMLIDSPGLRELEPWASVESAAAIFHDIQELAAQCRFRDCAHQSEPGCRVREAVEQGTLDRVRLESLHKLTGAMERLRRMEDVHQAQEYKRKLKQIHKAARAFYPR